MEQSGYFAVGEQYLYGTLYLPEEEPRKRLLVLPPFGEEKKCAFRLLVRLARNLQGKGVAVFMFDLGGTGESTGDHADATWRQWRTEGTEAKKLLGQTAGASDLWILGVRLGALLGADLMGAGTGGMILLEPILSGADFLRDLERRQRIKQVVAGTANPPETADAEQITDPDRIADFGGFGVRPELARCIAAENLLDTLEAGPPTRPLRLIRVSGGRKFPSNWLPLVAKTEASPGGRAVIVRDKPFWGQLEYYESNAVIDQVADCLLPGNPAPAPAV